MGPAQLRQPSRLVADLSAFLPVLQLYPLAMSFVYGSDPDSHLLGGWQLDPNKLNMGAVPGHGPGSDQLHSTRPEGIEPRQADAVDGIVCSGINWVATWLFPSAPCGYPDASARYPPCCTADSPLGAIHTHTYMT